MGRSSARSICERVQPLLAAPVIVDLRNIYRPEDMARHGFRYESIGRAGTGSTELERHLPTMAD